MVHNFRKTYFVIGIGIALLIGGFFCIKYFKEQSTKKAELQKQIDQEKENDEAEASIPVKIAKAQKGDLSLRLTISALTDAREKAVLRSEVEGIVSKVVRREGDTVAKNDLIVQLESSERLLALRDAEANRLQAYSRFISQYMAFKTDPEKTDTDRQQMERNRDEYEKSLTLYRESKISKDEMKKRENALLARMIEEGALQEEVKKVISGLTQSEITLERARLNLERTAIRAPFPGTVSEIKVSIGEKISVGTDIVRMVNLRSIFLKGFVLETELGKIQTGQGVRIRFLSFPGLLLRGRVSAISPEISPEKKTGTVFVEFDNPGTVFVGMDAELDIEYQIIRNVVKVPLKSLIVRSGRELIFVIDNDMALWRYVETGSRNDEEIEIKSGIAAREMVVVDGNLTLGHQAKVRIIR